MRYFGEEGGGVEDIVECNEGVVLRASLGLSFCGFYVQKSLRHRYTSAWLL